MACPLSIVSAVAALVWNNLRVLADIFTFFRLCLRSPAAVAAENLFLRKQLGLYIERKTNPRRATDSVRFTLARLSRFFDWRNTLTIVKPDTLIRWHRNGFRLFWKWKSRPRGRPRIPRDLRTLIAEMAVNNPTWGEERIADELLLKIGIRISPRTIPRYMRQRPRRLADPSQRLDDVRPPPCQTHHRQRLLRRRDGHVPGGLCVRHHGNPNQTYSALQRNPTSE